MTTRRHFLASMTAVVTAPRLSWASVGSPDFIAAAKVGDGFSMSGFTADGQVAFSVPLPARGHAGAGHPTLPIAIAFARRPGRYALVIDCTDGSVLQSLTPPEGIAFNGHGLFLDEGRLLVTVEQRDDDSQGQIGLWDVAQGYARMGEIATGGIGPHDIKLMPDGETLVIANGGIATDPSDRTKLNVPDMTPNLAYLTLDGVQEKVELDEELHFNSIRHLALRDDGLVAFAMQWQDDPSYAPPLLGLHRRGEEPVLADASLTEAILMDGYAGSIAFNGAGTEVAITSPKGGRIHRFTPEGAFLGAVVQPDVCGLVSLKDGFLASDGFGNFAKVSGDKLIQLKKHDVSWDNHIIAL